MNELIKQLRAQGIDVTIDGDHKSSEISFQIGGETVFVKGEVTLKREAGFYLGIMWGGTDPSITERFDTDELRDAELKRMLDTKHENSIGGEDAFFAVDIDEDGHPQLFAYSGSQVDEMKSSEG